MNTKTTLEEKVGELQRAAVSLQAAFDVVSCSLNYYKAENEKLRQLIPLVEEIMQGHADPENGGSYNECDDIPCQWCEDAKKALNP